MTLRERLERLVDGLPAEAEVTLPVEWVRRLLETERSEDESSDRLFTVQQLASRYDRSPSTVRGWLSAGEFPGAFKLRGAWRVPEAAVRRFEREGEGEGPALGRGRPVDLSSWKVERP